MPNKKTKRLNLKMPKWDAVTKRQLSFLGQALALFFGWRIALWLVAFLGKYRLELGQDPSYIWIPTDPWIPEQLPEWLQFFMRWDAGWYLSIMEHGYVYDVGANYSNLVFFPLYPLISVALSWLLNSDPLIAAFVVTNVALLCAMPLVWKLARKELDIDGSWRALLLLMIFPTSIFFGSVYTEALFLLFSVATFLLARNNKWWWSGLVGVLAVLTRPVGIFLVPALILEYFEQRGWKASKTKWDVFATIVPGAGLLGYMGYLWATKGNPLLFLSGQSEWSRSTSFQVPEFAQQFSEHAADLLAYQGDNMAFAIANSTDFLFLIFGLIIGALVLIQYRVSYGVYVLISVSFAAFTGSFHSIPRFLLVLFPIFFLLAHWGRKPGVWGGLIAISAVLFAIFSMMVANLWWVA